MSAGEGKPSRRAHREARGVVEALRHRRWAVWLWPVVGLAALVWFLARVLPKPSRATYPCQQVAAPLAASFVAWLVGLVGAVVAFRKARERLRESRLAVAALCVMIGLAAAAWGLIHTPAEPASAAFVPSEGANSPMGVAKGCHPGRVVWVHDPGATDWDGASGYYWEDSNTDQAAVDRMMSRSLRWLAGQRADAAAWDALFRHFNHTHGKGDIGYQTAERVTIKVNLVNCFAYDDEGNGVDTSPQLIRALLRQLVNQAGVPQAKITVYDSSRYVANKVWGPCHTEFPDVRFEDKAGGSGRDLATKDLSTPMDYAGPIATDHLPTCCVQADYLINAAALKRHSLAGFTLCAKNHFGSLCRMSPNSLHASIDTRNRGMGAYNPLVELMGHQHLDGKCMLFVVDGLYGAPREDAAPSRWASAPFNNDWPSSLLVSQDGVAIDSVGLDALRAEWTLLDNADNYLHEASQANAPPSETFYDPEGDGTRLTSQGVHEHWNNATDKQYTRNLGTGDGIELLALTDDPPQVDAGPGHTVAVGGWASLDGTVSGGRLQDASGPVTTVWSVHDGPGAATFAAAAAVDTAASFSEAGTHVLRLTATDGHLEAHDDVTITVLPVCTPGDLLVDLRVTLNDHLNVDGPAPTSLGIIEILLNGNATATQFAIRIQSAHVNAWLRLDEGLIHPDGQAKDWRTAGEWAGGRLVGLAVNTEYTFLAKALSIGGAESGLAPVGIHSTNRDCDVDRSGRVTALDHALVRAALLRGGAITWPCDLDGSGVIDSADGRAAADAILGR